MRYHNITKCDMLNGPGLRVVLWVSGCLHRCPECQNKLTWDPTVGLEFDDTVKQEIFDELDQDWCEGLTLSGGDPLYPTNSNEIKKFCKEVKEKYPNKSIWLYTGYKIEQIQDTEILEYIDVIVDGKFDPKQRTHPYPEWRGSWNQRIINLKE